MFGPSYTSVTRRPSRQCQPSTLTCSLLALGVLGLLISGSAAQEVSLHINYSADPVSIPSNISFVIAPKGYNAERFRISLWRCFGLDASRDDEPHDDQWVMICHRGTQCSNSTSQLLTPGNCTTRIEVQDDVHLFDPVVRTRTYFVPAHLDGVQLILGNATTFNELFVRVGQPVDVHVTPLPTIDLTGVVKLQLQFGDQQNATEYNVSQPTLVVSHVFQEPGIFNITSQATNNVSAASDAKTICVVRPPSYVHLRHDGNDLTPHQHINFTVVTDGTDANYTWDFGGDEVYISYEPFYSYAFADKGSHNITVTVAGPFGAALNSTAIVINPAVSTEQTIAITIPITLACIGLLLVGLIIRYRRIIFARRGVEKAEFSFLPFGQESEHSARRRGWMPSLFTPSQSTRTYGTVEMYDDL